MSVGTPPSTGSPLRQDPLLVEEALDLDLHYYSSQEDDSPQPLRGKAVATGAVSATDSLGNGADLQLEGHRIRSVVVRPATHRVSYKEALLRGRAFKTANNQRRPSHGRYRWPFGPIPMGPETRPILARSEYGTGPNIIGLGLARAR